MEKLKQDILSMFPSSSKSSNSYAVPVVTYKPAESYESPSYNEPEPSYNAPEPSYNAPEVSYEAPSAYNPPAASNSIDFSSLFQVEGKPPVSQITPHLVHSFSQKSPLTFCS